MVERDLKEIFLLFVVLCFLGNSSGILILVVIFVIFYFECLLACEEKTNCFPMNCNSDSDKIILFSLRASFFKKLMAFEISDPRMLTERMSPLSTASIFAPANF